jgi:hypothetical protein
MLCEMYAPHSITNGTPERAAGIVSQIAAKTGLIDAVVLFRYANVRSKQSALLAIDSMKNTDASAERHPFGSSRFVGFCFRLKSPLRLSRLPSLPDHERRHAKD